MKGLRAQILEELVKANDYGRWATGIWRGATRVFDPGSPHSRKALPEELPENDIAKLRKTREIMRLMRDYADNVSEMCTARINELEREGGDNE